MNWGSRLYGLPQLRHVSDTFREPEAANLGPADPVKEDIHGLQVPVDEPVGARKHLGAGTAEREDPPRDRHPKVSGQTLRLY